MQAVVMPNAPALESDAAPPSAAILPSTAENGGDEQAISLN
jgi:hypothetical protein